MYNLKEWRLQQGWSRSVLAEKVQVHESTVKRWEQGKTMPFPYNMGLLVRLGFLPFAPSSGGKMEKDAKNEQPSTYIVQDRSNQQELERLVYQDQMFTTIMGGLSRICHIPSIFSVFLMLDVVLVAGCVKRPEPIPQSLR